MERLVHCLSLLAVLWCLPAQAQYFNGTERWHSRISGEILTTQYFDIGGSRECYFAGTTTIGGKSYRELRRHRRDTTYYDDNGGIHSTFDVDELVGYLREDGQTVYIRYQPSQPEVVLYDFKLEIGSMIDFLPCAPPEPLRVVEGISTILVNGEARRVFQVSNTDYLLVEGIGWTEGPAENGCQDGSLQRQELLCFQRNGQNVVFSDDSPCGLISATASKALDRAVSVFPNPVVGDKLYIELPAEARITHLVLLDSQGRRLLAREPGAQRPIELSLEGIPTGLYIYAIKLKSGSIQQGKIIIKP